MMYISGLLLIIGVWIGAKSLRDRDKESGVFAFALLVAAGGTGMITYFALSTLSMSL